VSFVYFLEIELHLPENGSLKGKRKDVASVKAQLQRRFGAAVAETDHHDLWQRAQLSAALVARDARGVERAAAELERFLHARFPDGVRTDGVLLSGDELL
jgi:uncharacterized protein YlxP (DUF503 family)